MNSATRLLEVRGPPAVQDGGAEGGGVGVRSSVARGRAPLHLGAPWVKPGTRWLRSESRAQAHGVPNTENTREARRC